MRRDLKCMAHGMQDRIYSAYSTKIITKPFLRDSIVGIGTGYVLDDRGDGFFAEGKASGL
jgi:hypothetical protein